MSGRPLHRPARRRLAVVVAVASLALLAACSGGGDAEPTSSPTDGAGGASGDPGAFPVTIEHALGTTTIDEAPERVVTIGWASHDTALALGVVPVGVPRDQWAGDPDTGLLPWTAAAIEDLGGKLPTTFVDLPDVDPEEIVALAPDLVLATYSGISQDVYAQLSRVTDVIAYPDQPWLVGWQEQTVLNGTALGKADEAGALVEEMTAFIASTAAEHPELAGTTFAYVYHSPDGTLAAYVEGDPRVDLLTGLGMELAPGVAGLEPAEGAFYVDLGTENTDLLADADVLITWYNDEAEQAAIEASGTFAAIPAVQRGTYLPLLDRPLSMAMSTTTALSLPWGLAEFVPQLVAAVAGDGADDAVG